MKRPSIESSLHHLSKDNNEQHNEQTFVENLAENKRELKKLLGQSQDVMLTEFKIQLKNGEQLDALLIAIDGLVDEEAKRNNVLHTLIATPLQVRSKSAVTLDLIEEKLTVKSVHKEKRIEVAVELLLKSQAMILVDTVAESLIIAIEGFEIRSISEPETEQTVKGSREGFIETTSVNLSLIRRRIRHPSLRFETIELGQYSRTDILNTPTLSEGLVSTELSSSIEQSNFTSQFAPITFREFYRFIEGPVPIYCC